MVITISNVFLFSKTALAIYCFCCTIYHHNRRLNIFNDTLYELPSRSKRTFIIILFLLLTLPILSLYYSDWLYHWERNLRPNIPALSLFFVWFLLYILSAVWAVSIFERSLLSMAKTQADSVRDPRISIKFNAKQAVSGEFPSLFSTVYVFRHCH